MKRIAVVGVIAAVLMVAGCSKNSAGTASAESGVPASAESGVTTATNSVVTATADSGTAGEMPAAGTATAVWLSVYCKGLAPFADMGAELAAVNPDAGPDAAKNGLSDLAKE